MTVLLQTIAGAVAFIVLDAIWLGFVMNGFYRTQLASIARIENGSLAPNWPAAAVVYVLLGLGIAIFVLPRAGSIASAAAYGAVLGAVVYGVYDFTNFATLKAYPFTLVLVDLAWGTAVTAMAAAAVKALVR